MSETDAFVKVFRSGASRGLVELEPGETALVFAAERDAFISAGALSSIFEILRDAPGGKMSNERILDILSEHGIVRSINFEELRK
jgi:hypothetical protein